MKIEDKIDNFINESEADRMARWGNTFGKKHGIMPDESGFFSLCVEHMTGNVENPEGYCARVKDNYAGSSFWRGKGKTEKEVKTDTKKHPNVEKGKRDPA